MGFLRWGKACGHADTWRIPQTHNLGEHVIVCGVTATKIRLSG